MQVIVVLHITPAIHKQHGTQIRRNTVRFAAIQAAIQSRSKRISQLSTAQSADIKVDIYSLEFLYKLLRTDRSFTIEAD